MTQLFILCYLKNIYFLFSDFFVYNQTGKNDGKVRDINWYFLNQQINLAALL